MSINTLLKRIDSNADLCLYTDNPDKFMYGRVLASNEVDTAFYSISPEGGYDGVNMIPTDSISRIEVELNCVIENRTKLIVDRFEIHRRERLAIFIGLFHHRVLPVYHVSWFDLVHAPASEIRKNFAFNNALLCLPGIELDTVFGVLLVELIESLKSHIEVSCVFEKEILLPLGGFTLGLKASLHFAICFAFPVGISC